MDPRFDTARRYREAMAPRYRCRACGNLTRFDVVATRRTLSYHHFSLGGELVIEEQAVLEESVEEVSCRWCASSRAVEQLGPAVLAETNGS